jgi:hypothetical protein
MKLQFYCVGHVGRDEFAQEEHPCLDKIPFFIVFELVRFVI